MEAQASDACPTRAYQTARVSMYGTDLACYVHTHEES
jgi:hypothetical protein